MNIRHVLPILAMCVGFASCANIDRVFQMQNENSLMIASGGFTYAMSSALFSSENWQTVSVAGNNLTIVSPDCSRIETTFDQLTDAQRTILDSVLSSFESSEADNKDQYLIGEFYANDKRAREGRPMTSEVFGTDNIKYLLRRVSDENFSICAGELEAKKGIFRIFFVGDTVTIAYASGKVEMMPRKCLDESSRNIVQGIFLTQKQYIIESRMRGTLRMLERVYDLDARDENN